MEIMRDHDSSPQAICLHPDPDEGDEASACLFSMVADVERRPDVGRRGQPLRAEYEEIDLVRDCRRDARGRHDVRSAHCPKGERSACWPHPGPYFNRSDIQRPVEWWEAKGYRVKLTDGIWSKDDYVAGPPEERAADLNALFADPEVDVIQALWGGTGAMQMLPHLDYDLDRREPQGVDGLLGHHEPAHRDPARAPASPRCTGPGLGSMGIPERTAFTWDSALAGFTRGATGPGPRDPDDPYVRTIAPGRVTAPIVGGNLFTFVHLIGTPWDPVFDGAILFFEEVHEPAYHHRGPPRSTSLGGQARWRCRGGRRRAQGL